MRRTIIAFMSTISALVLLFSYPTSTNSAVAAATSTSAGTASAASATARSSTTTSASAATTSGGTDPTTDSAADAAADPAVTSSASATYTGDAVNTRWGLVQVQITVENGAITDSQAIQYPTENGKDRQINSYAVPQLNQETLSAQSSSIDAVSGATVTSDGYIESLQSAIDQANL